MVQLSYPQKQFFKILSNRFFYCIIILPVHQEDLIREQCAKIHKDRGITVKRLMKNILQESKPYDFLLLMVSAIVGFVLSLFGDTIITCVCATVIVVLFMLFIAISENALMSTGGV